MEKFTGALASLPEAVQMVLSWRSAAPSSLPRPPRRRGGYSTRGPLPSSLCPGASVPVLTPPSTLPLPHRAVPRLGEPLPSRLWGKLPTLPHVRAHTWMGLLGETWDPSPGQDW